MRGQAQLSWSPLNHARASKQQPGPGCVVLKKLSTKLSSMSPEDLNKQNSLFLGVKTATRVFCAVPGTGESTVDIMWKRKPGAKKPQGRMQLTEMISVKENECKGHESCILLKGVNQDGEAVVVKAWPETGSKAQGHPIVELAHAVERQGGGAAIARELRLDAFLTPLYDLAPTDCGGGSTQRLYVTGPEVEALGATLVRDRHGSHENAAETTPAEDLVLAMLPKMTQMSADVAAELADPNTPQDRKDGLTGLKAGLPLRRGALAALVEDPEDQAACTAIYNMYIKKSTGGLFPPPGEYPMNLPDEAVPVSAADFCGSAEARAKIIQEGIKYLSTQL